MSVDTSLKDRVEKALWLAPAEVVARRFRLRMEELKDLCPEHFEEEQVPDRNTTTGY